MEELEALALEMGLDTQQPLVGQIRDTWQKLHKQVESTEQIGCLRQLSVPENQQRYYQFEILQSLKEGQDFGEAARDYIAQHPPFAPPAFAQDPGQGPDNSLQSQYRQAVQNRDYPLMSRLMRLAGEKKITLV